jgi:anti-sigma regulatory factor (Ser/Thr protein kinase)
MATDALEEDANMGDSHSWELPRDSTAPAQGRWHVRGLASSDREAVDAELVVTELITNAWKHGYGSAAISLRVDVLDDSMHLEVCGEAEGEPSPQGAQPDTTSGRGLLLIDELATRWGFSRNGSLVCVWADIPRLD